MIPMEVRSGRVENVPYSLSRWTDVPAAKWPWFKETLKEGSMLGFKQRELLPTRWSVLPEETLGLLFWTKDPSNLLRDRKDLAAFEVRVHVTLTGWHEVEKGAPNLIEGTVLLQRTAFAFGPENVTWRFSPVPALPDEEVLDRFRRILAVAAPAGVRSVYLSFLQPNDLVPETRDLAARRRLMQQLAALANPVGVRTLLCNEDRTLDDWMPLSEGLQSGVCAPPEAFAVNGRAPGPVEGCGCSLMVDPFSLNESCTFGCLYCYAADRTSSPHKRNTTRALPVLR